MKSFKKLICAVLSVVCIISGLAGCGSDYKEAYIYFELNDRPDTLDAQTAQTDTELLIVKNIYEGLLRKNESGAIACGVAEEYDKNGLTYTFKLRPNARWSNGEPLTADDFVFGMRRAVLPETNSPFANRLFCIANAKAINQGEADISQLGVIASDHQTVTITLEYEDESFEETLTSSVCMPCNEEFFNSCAGKYGLTNNDTISNGSYSIRKWDRENFGIRLYRNKEYSGAFTALNAAVFLSNREDKSPLDLLERKTIDGAFLDNEQAYKAEKLGINVLKYQNICWFLSIGSQYDEDIRSCFSSTFSSDIYKASLPHGFEAASSAYPKILGLEDLSGVGLSGYDVQTAKQKFSNLVAKMENKRFPSAVLYYYDKPEIKQAVTDIVGHWQQNLSAFINIEPSSSLDSLTAQLKNQSLPFAVFPVKITSNLLSEYMLNFNASGNDAASLQKSIFAKSRILPIAFENTNIAFGETIEKYSSENKNGYIDFAFLIKDE